MEQLIRKIKEKKELSDIPDKMVEEIIKDILRKGQLKIPEGKKNVKELVKSARAELRKYTGRFHISSRRREKLLEGGRIEELLKSHTSTKERIEIYPEVVEMISKINPKSILDLGCGLNPIYISKEFPKAEYLAYDIKKNELKLIEKFFKENKINGKTFFADIRKAEFPEADLCLIFKTLDIIETKGHKYAHQIVKNLKSKYIIASFSTKTLSGKPMKNSRRFWFESILNALNYGYKINKFSNEIFYIVNSSAPTSTPEPKGLRFSS